MEEKKDGLLEELTTHMVQKDKLEKLLLGMEIAMMVMTLFLVDLQRRVIYMETAMSTLINTNDKF